MIKWRKRLATTSASYPTKGSFYTQYIILTDSNDNNIEAYEEQGEQMKANIIRKRADGSYKNEPQAVLD